LSPYVADGSVVSLKVTRRLLCAKSQFVSVTGNLLRTLGLAGSLPALMGRILGVDYGRRRVGLALSDPTGLLAAGLTTLEVQTPGEALKRVVTARVENGAAEIVVGLPLNMDGTRGPMGDEAAEFARRLGEIAGVPVRLWDERMTTGMAERVLLDADMSRQRRKAVRDKLAAQLILQGYLDSRQPPMPPRDEDDDDGTR